MALTSYKQQNVQDLVRNFSSLASQSAEEKACDALGSRIGLLGSNSGHSVKNVWKEISKIKIELTEIHETEEKALRAMQENGSEEIRHLMSLHSSNTNGKIRFSNAVYNEAKESQNTYTSSAKTICSMSALVKERDDGIFFILPQNH